MIWVHFCVYTGPSPGRAVQQMRPNSRAKAQPAKQIKKEGGYGE